MNRRKTNQKNPWFTEKHYKQSFHKHFCKTPYSGNGEQYKRETSWNWIADQNLNECCESNMAHVITEGVTYAFMGTEFGSWIPNEPVNDFN